MSDYDGKCSCDECAEIADLSARLTALQATADRYREALEASRNLFELLRGHVDHQLVPDLDRLIADARDALADTSPPAQPAPSAGKTARRLEDWPDEPVCGECLCHCSNCVRPAAQPVALRPAREVVGEAMRDWPVKIQPLLRLGVLDKITAAIEADRAQRGMDPATVEACAQEAFSWDIDWSVGIAENLGRLGLRIRSLLSSPGGAR